MSFDLWIQFAVVTTILACNVRLNLCFGVLLWTMWTMRCQTLSSLGFFCRGENKIEEKTWRNLTQAQEFFLLDWLMIAYIALFSALLSRLTALACGSTWVTSFVALFFFFFWISTEVVYLQCWHGWCHMKLQPSRRKSCVHHTTMHHVTSSKATYVRCMRV